MPSTTRRSRVEDVLGLPASRLRARAHERVVVPVDGRGTDGDHVRDRRRRRREKLAGIASTDRAPEDRALVAVEDADAVGRERAREVRPGRDHEGLARSVGARGAETVTAATPAVLGVAVEVRVARHASVGRVGRHGVERRVVRRVEALRRRRERPRRRRRGAGHTRRGSSQGLRAERCYAHSSLDNV